MLGKSSSWRQPTALERRAQSSQLQTAHGHAGVQRPTARPRFLPVAVATLGVAFGCTAEERTFGDLSGDAGPSSGDSESVGSTRPVDSVEPATGNGTASSHGAGTDGTPASGDNASTNETTDGATDASGEGSGGSTTGHGTSGAPTTDATDGPVTSDPSSGDDATSTDHATTGDTSTDPGTSETTTAPDETTGGIDFGVGEPPNYGNLGSGDGHVLVVNTLEEGAPVDVWLAGGARPVIEDLSTETASRVGVTRGAQRVVFTRAGTQDVVGCSEWFPLRGEEQWAVVPSGSDHTCSGSGDGATSSFRQAQPLDENPIRYVHATAPDRFSFIRDQQAEAGTLDAGGTLTGTSMPNCTSGCEVNYGVSASGVATERPFTLRVSTAGELPVAGEVMLIVLGNIRQDWPAEPDALRLLRVDLDAATYLIQRDPEIAFGRLGDTPVTFTISTPPSSTEVATVDPYCGEDQCPLEVRPWRAGTRTFFAEGQEGGAELTVELETGHRYVLLSTPDRSYPLYWLDADFDRSQTTEAYVRGVNLDTYGNPIAMGYVFGGSAVAIDTLTSLPWGGYSDGNGGQVPAEDNVKIVTGDNPESLGTSCFYSVDFRSGYRGYLVESEPFQPLDVTAWPPTMGYSFKICN